MLRLIAYTTCALNRSAIFLPGGLPVFINGYGVPFLSYAYTPHRPPQAASVRRWKRSARSFSDI